MNKLEIDYSNIEKIEISLYKESKINPYGSKTNVLFLLNLSPSILMFDSIIIREKDKEIHNVTKYMLESENSTENTVLEICIDDPVSITVYKWKDNNTNVLFSFSASPYKLNFDKVILKQCSNKREFNVKNL